MVDVGSPGQIQVVGDVQDLDEVQIARESLASLNPGDGGYVSKLQILSRKLMSRFSRLGNPGDLDEAINLTKQVLDLTLPGHPDHLGALSNTGNVLVKRFKFRGDANDLMQAIGYFEVSVEACTPENPSYVPLVANLCSGLLNRYWMNGDVVDLDLVVEKSSYALSTSCSDGPNRDTLFNNWATVLRERFRRQGNRDDLETALAHHQHCLSLRPPGHPLRHNAFGNLADAFIFRFEVDGHLQDLESAANNFISALQLCSPGQEGYQFYFTGLGVVYMHFYSAQGDRKKLEMAIGCYQTAMEHSTVHNLDYSRLLDNYGTALQLRYGLLGNVNDLDQAIRYLTTSSEITPPMYSGRAVTSFSLATALFERFGSTRVVADLNSSVEKFTSALQSCDPGYHQRSTMLSMYGCALSARFKTKGDIQDLNLAASVCKEALALVSPREVNYSSAVGNASMTLYDYFYYKSGSMEDIQIILDHCDRALASVPPEELNFINLKAIRTKALFQKSLNAGEETGISSSIATFREIIATIPEGHKEYVPVHLSLGIALHTRFQLLSDAKDLDEAVIFHRAAQRSCTRDHTNYVYVCIQLANVLLERCDYYQDSSDALDEVTLFLAEAEDILSAMPEHSDRKASLANLGCALFMRFQAQRNREDLDAAIEHLSRALTLPGPFDEFLIPFSLATALSSRYNETKDLDDLERSVKLFGTADEQMPCKHRARGILYQNCGVSFFKLAKHRDPLQCIDGALFFYREALKHFPPSHHYQLSTLMRIAVAQHERAARCADENGLYDAIKLIRDVIQTLPEDSPMFGEVYQTAATLSMSTWKTLESHPPSFMEDGFRYYEKAASYTYHHSFTSVTIPLEWATVAEEQCHSSALLAYQTCFAFLNQYLLSTASIKSRRAALLDKTWVKKTSTLATDATACAIARGRLELAVELSEQGRGLLWSQIAQSHTPLDTLRSASDVGLTLASNFERLSGQLAQIAVAHSGTSVKVSRLTTEEATHIYRQLSRELEDTVARIRQQDGFQSFLDRPSFESLQHAAFGGPVILVNASRQRCDALIVLHGASPRLVPLPNTTLEDLSTLSADLYHMLKTTSHVGEEKIRERQLVLFLRTLWDTVVSPIVDELAEFLPRGARIWWCPTSKLTSLPLHAAGPYRKGGLNLANMYVSSYTPTLAALIRVGHQPSPPESRQMPPAFVAISQAKPSSSTSPELRTVDAELTLVQSLLPTSVIFSALSSEASTGDAVLDALSTHAWAHLACHGHPNVDQPFDSSFALSDRAVTILDIIGDRRVHDAGVDSDVNASLSEFAFLSACHTAVGDRDAPDEIIHLAAAMQFAGFRSVVGTMWAVDDGMAKEMVKAFYTHMFARSDGSSQGHRWDCTEAARALNRASKSVDKNLVSIDQRIVFIHIGA